MTIGLSEIAAEYRTNGVAGGVPVLTATEAEQHRSALENAEAEIGSLHFIDKVHTVLTSPLVLERWRELHRQMKDGFKTG
jgi:hypothetical protein